jgi:hypothetical protein
MNTSFRMVDFPAPLGPVRNANSPFAMWNETSFNARPVRGYSLMTWENRIIWRRIRRAAVWLAEIAEAASYGR